MSESTEPGLVEFLAARFAEDEAVARDAAASDIGTVAHGHMERWDPWRVLAEVESKRRIVAMHTNRIDRDEGHPLLVGQREGLGLAVVVLASVYADHPDYRDEWRI